MNFNEQIETNVENITGRWTGGPPTKNSDKIISLLRMNELIAMNTIFRPKKNQSVHTFLQSKRSEAASTNEKYIGRAVKAKYRGRWVRGTVIAPSLLTSEPAWIVRYNDGYVATYNEKELKKIMIHILRKTDTNSIIYLSPTGGNRV